MDWTLGVEWSEIWRGFGVEFGGDFGVEFGVCVFFPGGFLESMGCSTE